MHIIMWSLTILLVLIYGAANILLNIPTFLKVENFLYILLYPALTYLYLKKNLSGPLIALAFFNAGRISRTIVTPEGNLHDMAFNHIPVFALLLMLGFLAIFKRT